MIESLWIEVQPVVDQVSALFGFDRDLEDVNSAQMAGRAVIVYVLALLLVRAGSKRLLGRATAFDVIVAILLGSVLSRGINGSAPFLPTILAAAALIAMHALFATIAFRTSFFGPLVKGEPRLLIKDGEVQEDQMREAKLSEHDLEQALRGQALRDPARVRRAYLERDGSISIIPFEKEPQVLDVGVEDGTQTIRIKVE